MSCAFFLQGGDAKKMKIKATVLSLCILSLLGLPGCNHSANHEKDSAVLQGSAFRSQPTEDQTKEEPALPPGVDELADQALDIAYQYKGCYILADKEKEEYFPNDIVLSQKSIDQIEDQLMESGYPVLDSDETYPSYLSNSQGFYDFWESAAENKEAEQHWLSIAPTGALHFQEIIFNHGIRQYTTICIEWDEHDEPYIGNTEQREVLDWELTEAGNFYFQIVPSDQHYDDYSLIRLEPIDQELYDLNAKYIIPLGYQSKNIFTCDWNSADFGELCLNDLFEFLYRVKYGDYYQGHSGGIPSDLFEHVVKPYFDITWEEFRERSLYDEETKCYPWQEIGSDNLTYYPALEPDVVEKRENTDGTVTLVVDVRCNNYKQDRMLTHEVTIRQLEDGGYQYIQNQITYQGEEKLPPYRPRVS